MLKMITICLLFSVFKVSAEPIDKTIFGETVYFPIPKNMVPLCEKNINYWKFMKSQLPEAQHLLTCLIDNKTLEADMKNPNQLSMSALIVASMIRKTLTPSSFSQYKDGAIKAYEGNRDEAREINGVLAETKRSEFSILENTKNRLVIYETVSSFKNGKLLRELYWYRALVLIQGKPIDLRVYFDIGHEYTKEQIIEIGSNWLRSIEDAN